MARDTLKTADIPFFAREENLSGLSLAFPAVPTPGIGTTWSLYVPESFADKAKELLSPLPIELDKQPDFWDFTSDPKVIRWFKIFILINLIGVGLIILREIIKAIF